MVAMPRGEVFTISGGERLMRGRNSESPILNQSLYRCAVKNEARASRVAFGLALESERWFFGCWSYRRSDGCVQVLKIVLSQFRITEVSQPRPGANSDDILGFARSRDGVFRDEILPCEHRIVLGHPSAIINFSH